MAVPNADSTKALRSGSGGHAYTHFHVSGHARVHAGDNITYADASPEQKVLNWLLPANLRAPNFEAREREPGTNLWFLESPVYRHWRDQPGSNLWLYGSVGCGKTTMFTAIDGDLRRSLATTSDQALPAAVATFYFSSTNNEYLSLNALLRSLIAQPCSIGSIPSQLLALYDLHNQALPPTGPSVAELNETLYAIIATRIAHPNNDSSSKLSQVSRQIYILVDALDEIPYGHRRDEVVQMLDTLACRRLECLHVLIISRPETDISLAIKAESRWTTAPFPKVSVQRDIALYVEKEVLRHRGLARLPQKARQMIIERLSGQGNGM